MRTEELKKSFSWEIDNFSDWNDEIKSEPFSSGGCEWYLRLLPKGSNGCDTLSPFLHVANTKSLRLGWKRRAYFFFVFLNQSGKELFNSSAEGCCRCVMFCAESPNGGFLRTLPLSKLQEEGFLENNKLIIQAYIQVVELVHQGKSTENDIFDFNGVQILSSQAISAGRIFHQRPDFAIDFHPKTLEEKTAYLTLFFCLIETLSKSPHSLSATELRNAQNILTELTKAGFKLDWLKLKLNDVSLVRKETCFFNLDWLKLKFQNVSLERKKTVSDGSQLQQLEERLKNVEMSLSALQAQLDKENIIYAAPAKVSSFVFINLFIKRFFLSCFSI